MKGWPGWVELGVWLNSKVAYTHSQVVIHWRPGNWLHTKPACCSFTQSTRKQHKASGRSTVTQKLLTQVKGWNSHIIHHSDYTYKKCFFSQHIQLDIFWAIGDMVLYSPKINMSKVMHVGIFLKRLHKVDITLRTGRKHKTKWRGMWPNWTVYSSVRRWRSDVHCRHLGHRFCHGSIDTWLSRIVVVVGPWIDSAGRWNLVTLLTRFQGDKNMIHWRTYNWQLDMCSLCLTSLFTTFYTQVV